MTPEEAMELICQITDGGVEFGTAHIPEGTPVECFANDLSTLLNWAAMNPVIACDVASALSE